MLPVAPTLSGKENKKMTGHIQDNIHNERQKIEILRSDGRQFLNFIQGNYERKMKVHVLCPYLTFKAYRSRDAPTVQHSTTVRSAHTVFMCFVFI
jgi:hypothetical protein